MRAHNRLYIAAQEYWKPLVLSLGILLVSFWLQVQVSPSPITHSETEWQAKIDYHLTTYPFSIRPFQTYTTLGLHRLSGLPLRESFFTIQFALALILSLVFYRFLIRLGVIKSWALVGLALLLTAYPMLGAHFEPTHTWDDFWGYLFLTLGFLSLVNRLPLTASVWLTLAVIAREPIAVFLPVFFLALWWERKSWSRLRMIGAVALPLVVLAAYRMLLGEEADFSRWAEHVAFNFGTPLKRSDTLASIIIAFGFLWPLSVAGLVRLARKRDLAPARLIAVGFAMTLPLTVLLTLTGGRAIETRIFFPPFIFVVPLALLAVQSASASLRNHWSRMELVGLAALTLVFCAAGVVASQQWLFPDFDYNTNATVRQDLVGIYLGAWVAGVIIWGMTGRKEKARAAA